MPLAFIQLTYCGSHPITQQELASFFVLSHTHWKQIKVLLFLTKLINGFPEGNKADSRGSFILHSHSLDAQKFKGHPVTLFWPKIPYHHLPFKLGYPFWAYRVYYRSLQDANSSSLTQVLFAVSKKRKRILIRIETKRNKKTRTITIIGMSSPMRITLVISEEFI